MSQIVNTSSTQTLNLQSNLPNRRRFLRSFVLGGALCFSFNSLVAVPFRLKKTATRHDNITINAKERCPVCGMFVSPYPKWLTQIQFNDGTHHSFDGMKCLFRFYFSSKKYGSEKLRSDIKRILVRDYYTLKFIEHNKATYVVGSNIHGPMGHELIPFATGEEARVFLKDHFGQRLYRFEQVTPQLLDRLDKSKRTIILDGIP